MEQFMVDLDNHLSNALRSLLVTFLWCRKVLVETDEALVEAGASKGANIDTRKVVETQVVAEGLIILKGLDTTPAGLAAEAGAEDWDPEELDSGWRPAADPVPDRRRISRSR